MVLRRGKQGMTLETFFEKFDQFADAPDAVVSSRICVITFHLAPLAPASAGVMNLVRISASVRAFLFMLLRSSAAAASQSLASKPMFAEKPFLFCSRTLFVPCGTSGHCRRLQISVQPLSYCPHPGPLPTTYGRGRTWFSLSRCVCSLENVLPTKCTFACET